MPTLRETEPATKELQQRNIDSAPVSLHRILVALDQSDHANQALRQSVDLAKAAGGKVTGIHAYAAAMHDRRFRQMEGGLPERYRKEKEMEYQREVHDDLISQGLNIISDSYHDYAQGICDEKQLPYGRMNAEGKNYACIVDAAQSGEFDVLALGALGLGAVPASRIGTVCERVVRRSPIDTFIAKGSGRRIGEGPIVVGMDGSEKSFGALRTAIDIARHVDGEVHVVAAYDPYYHYVAFNKIAGVLSDEAGKVFRFKEQEQLHEELIDEGIAKIYQSHLAVAETVAQEQQFDIQCKLLDGKPWQAIADYLEQVGASLLVVGKTGIHADDQLDIGGNTENLLRNASCHIWIGQTCFTPALDVVADNSVKWSEEAEQLMARAPSFVQNMARKAVIRHAHELGHTFITAGIVQTVMGKMMPPSCPAKGKSEFTRLDWTPEAEAMIGAISDDAVGENIRLRAEKAARRDGLATVNADLLQGFLGAPAPAPEQAGEPDHGPAFASPAPAFEWQAAALARLQRVPETMQAKTRQRIEDLAHIDGQTEIDLPLVERGLEQARAAMERAIAGENPPAETRPDAQKPKGCPFGHQAKNSNDDLPLNWSDDAEKRMLNIPEGFMRQMTRQRIETYARKNGAHDITAALVTRKYADWQAGSAKQSKTMPWDAAAVERIARIPEFVQGMVIKEVERCAREAKEASVSVLTVDKACKAWIETGDFHLEGNADLYKED